MKRYWEVDAFRGIALFLMVIYHYIIVLDFFGISENLFNYRIYEDNFPPMFALSFLFILGVSLTLSYNKSKDVNKTKYIKRGLKILFIGIIISIITYILFPSMFIYFGILHLIGISLILSPIFVDKKWLSLITSFCIYVVSFFIREIFVSNRILSAIGFSSNIPTFDRHQLFPRLAMVLIGIFFGHILYPKGKRKFKLKRRLKVFYPFEVIGKNTLKIYLLHMPLFILILIILGFNIL